MRAYDLILRKRQGGELTGDQIRFLVEGYVRGDIPDYQLAAWCMAVYFQGLSDRETADLTMALVDSGDRLDLSAVPPPRVDKHSTGGVGDKTTLVTAPLAAAAGLSMAKMSGRGLGHTGGTLDKLEAIPGFRTRLEPQAFLGVVRRVGCAVVGQTGRLVPGDGLLYALRDVTATVDSKPLIAASVMSKKIAGGAGHIVLDVKTGSGAFMKDLDDALDLARRMVAIGSRTGLSTTALVTDMSQPLGRAVGNALEVAEAVAVLAGGGPADLRELSVILVAQLLCQTGRAASLAEGRERAGSHLDDGSALDRFRRMVAEQGGDHAVADDPGSRLPAPRHRQAARAPRDGFVQAIDAQAVGLAAMALGAGRSRKEDPIDPAAGVVLHRKVGDPVRAGEVLADLCAGRQPIGEETVDRLVEAFKIGPEQATQPRLIHGTVTERGEERWTI